MKPKKDWDKGYEDGYMDREPREPKNSEYMDGYWAGIQAAMLDE